MSQELFILYILVQGKTEGKDWRNDPFIWQGYIDGDGKPFGRGTATSEPTDELSHVIIGTYYKGEPHGLCT